LTGPVRSAAAGRADPLGSHSAGPLHPEHLVQFGLMTEFVEMQEKPTVAVKWVVAGAYNGCRGGVAGLGHLVWKVFQEKDEDGKMIPNPSDPQTCPIWWWSVSSLRGPSIRVIRSDWGVRLLQFRPH